MFVMVVAIFGAYSDPWRVQEAILCKQNILENRLLLKTFVIVGYAPKNNNNNNTTTKLSRIFEL